MYATQITHRGRLVDRATPRSPPVSGHRWPSNTPARRSPVIRCCEQLV